ncbi:MAG TPA: glycosyltransferase [Ktedonobacteraceae bacterium]|nr:glycosyltransferase [Ktedonobacteraceae bacterium]
MTTRSVRHGIPSDILALSHERDELRKRGHYDRADELKKLIEDAGYGIKDNPRGAHLIILPSIEVDGTFYRMARQVPSLLNESDTCLFSVLILANNRADEVRRCVESILRYAGSQAIEIVVIDNASQDDLATWARACQQETALLHVIHASRTMGEAEAYNLGLKQSRGRFILQLDPGLELSGDIFTPLARQLEQEDVGLTGLRGLRTDDLRHFEEREQEDEEDNEVEAITGTCLAFRRKLLKKIGLFDEGYRFPFYMDIDFNFAARASGVRALVTRDLPLIQHPVQAAVSLSDAERTRLTRRNFYRFLEKWGDREDLLLDGYDEDDEEYEDEEE